MSDWLAEAGIQLGGGNAGAYAGAPQGDAVVDDPRERMLRLLNAWRTETNAPELLAYDVELVDAVKSSLKEQVEALDTMFEEVDEEEREKRHFTSTLYQMELERVRYSLARYLRTRILKIEDSLEYVLTNPDMLDRLSYAEKAFATRLYELNNNHFEDHLVARLREMPGDVHEILQMSGDRAKHAQPSMNEFVFIMALEDLDHVVMDESNADSGLRKHEVWVVRYSSVHREVLQGNAILL